VVPPNTTAEVMVPATGKTLTVNGVEKEHQELISKKGIKYHFLKTGIGSGTYVFKTDYKL